LTGTAELAVVVLDVPGGDVAKARRRYPDAEIIVVTQQRTADDALPVFPLGSCYARNRGAAATDAPQLAFIDSDDDSEPLVVTREELVRVGGFDHVLGFGTTRRGPHDAELSDRLGTPLAVRTPFARAEAVAAGRTARRLRSFELAARAVSHGGIAGVLGRDRWRPPDPPPHLPAELQHLAPLTPLGASNAAKTHFLYGHGTDSVVHLYVNPLPRLRRALDEREQIRRRVGRGVPPLRITAEGRDCLWLVESRLPGQPPRPEQAASWFPQVTDWLLRMADPDGEPLARSPSWRQHADALRGAFPSVGLDHALELVGALPAVAMHGDLQPRNLLLDGSTVGAVDWEGAWLEGLPGLDLVFLSLFATAGEPDLSILDTLAAGGDVPWGGVRAALTRLGVDDTRLPATLLVMLGTWALSESRRRRRLGAAPPPPTFERALAERGHALGARV
jgi:hypothetical protein